jgi:hypothetical protein
MCLNSYAVEICAAVVNEMCVVVVGNDTFSDVNAVAAISGADGAAAPVARPGAAGAPAVSRAPA